MISIVIPAYNSSATIVEALESVAAQTLWEVKREELAPSLLTPHSSLYEVIIVDDCSTDNTVEVVEAWLDRTGTRSTCSRPSVRGGASDGTTPGSSGASLPSPASHRPVPPLTEGRLHCPSGNWRLLRQQHNSGPAAARNAGIAAACGEWIAFLDADDVWLPGKLELQMSHAARYPGVDLWCGEAVRFQAPSAPVHGYQLSVMGETNNEEQGTDNALRAVPLEELAERNPIATSTVMVRRSLLQQIEGFDTRFRGPEDYDLWLRVADRGELRYIARPLSAYRYKPGSLSTDDSRFLGQVTAVLRKAYGQGGVLQGRRGLRKAVAYQTMCCAWMAAERRAYGRALALWVGSIRVWPFSCSGRFNSMPWARLKLLWYLVRKWLRNDGHHQ